MQKIVNQSTELIKRQFKLIIGIIIGLLLGGSAFVFAAVPNANGSVIVCYRTSGPLANGNARIIDTANQSCNANETSVALDKASPGNFLNNLVGADLTNTSLAHRNFVSANLSDAKFGETIFNGADFRNANLSSIEITNGTTSEIFMKNTIFENVNFSNAVFTDGVYRVGGANFKNANFNNVDWTGSVLDGAGDFSNALFVNSSLQGSTIADSIFTGATWLNTICSDGTISNDNGNTCIGHLVP